MRSFTIEDINAYPLENQREFQARVNSSANGFISWDFLSFHPKTAHLLGDQYHDVLESRLHAMRNIFGSLKGALKEENLNALHRLAVLVSEERTEQRLKFKQDWNDHNFVVLVHAERMWHWIRWVLNSHIGFPEHNAVDYAAKQATLFCQMSNNSRIPAADYKNHYRSLALQKWCTCWRNQPPNKLLSIKKTPIPWKSSLRGPR